MFTARTVRAPLPHGASRGGTPGGIAVVDFDHFKGETMATYKELKAQAEALLDSVVTRHAIMISSR